LLIYLENLENVLAAEREKGDEFASGLHPHYIEIASILQLRAPEDLQPGLADMQLLIQSIREVRQQKILAGLLSLDGVPLFVFPFLSNSNLVVEKRRDNGDQSGQVHLNTCDGQAGATESDG
jgi:hypothetical protein